RATARGPKTREFPAGGWEIFQTGARPRGGPDIHRSAVTRFPRYVGRTGRARFRPGRSFVTEARQSGAPDVRALTDALLARAAGSGGQLRSTEVAQAVEDAEVSPS